MRSRISASVSCDGFSAERRRDVAGHAEPGLGEHAGRRTNLPGRAIAALESVMLDERVL